MEEEKKVWVITCKEYLSKQDLTSVQLVGTYDDNAAALLKAIKVRDDLFDELKKEGEKTKLFSTNSIFGIYCGKKEFGVYEKNYFIEIHEMELNTEVNSFV